MTRRTCARCGNPIVWCYYGWRHARGGKSPLPSCGQKPEPST